MARRVSWSISGNESDLSHKRRQVCRSYSLRCISGDFIMIVDTMLLYRLVSLVAGLIYVVMLAQSAPTKNTSREWKWAIFKSKFSKCLRTHSVVQYIAYNLMIVIRRQIILTSNSRNEQHALVEITTYRELPTVLFSDF